MSPIHQFLQKDRNTVTALTKYFDPKDLSQVSTVSKLFNKASCYQCLLFIKPSYRELAENNPIQYFIKYPEARRSFITIDKGGQEYVQSIFQEGLGYLPITIMDLSTVEKVEKLFVHMQSQIHDFPSDPPEQLPEIFHLEFYQRRAVEYFRSVDEVRGITEPQADALGSFSHLTREQVYKDWFVSAHYFALQKNRSYKEIEELTVFQAHALSLFSYLTREQVNHEWFDFTCIEELHARKSYEQVKQNRV